MKKLLCILISVLLTFHVLGAFSATAEEPASGTDTSVSEDTSDTSTESTTAKPSTTKATTTQPTTSPHPANGWSKDKKLYYVKNKPAKGFLTIGKKKYYFDTKTGVKAVGVKKIGNDYYGFASDGAMKYGWQDMNKARYYFNKKTGKALKGMNKIDGWKYYFSGEGKMQVGWVTYGGKKYFFAKKKSAYGKCVAGKATIDGVKYRFNKDGTLAEIIDAMSEKAQSYSSPTKYLILVNKKTHKVGIYKGKKGKWNRVKLYDCTIGAKETPTPSGNFIMNTYKGRPYHQRYFDSGKVRCWYATRIVRGINFHSVLYTQASTPKKVANGRLGANLSHGCVRLKIENAKWIYDNIPKKTRCVIY